jgi:hypothetical protein
MGVLWGACAAKESADINRFLLFRVGPFTIELHLLGLIGTARHPDVQKIRIIGFFILK